MRLFLLSMKIQCNLDIRSAKGLAKFVRYNEVSLYRGSFPYIFNYYYRGQENRSLNRGLCYIEFRYIEVPL